MQLEEQVLVKNEGNEDEKKQEELSLEEVENLSYYDFMGYMEVPFFAIGGTQSTESLAELCRISEGKKVLFVGCGTGGNAVHVAKEFGCFIIGVDISEKMVAKAIERAENEELTDKVEFKIGDAYALSFDDDSFDVVITEFVSQFLDRTKAFKEFKRVLKPGGYLGINEMMKFDEIPEAAAEKIDEGEKIFQELTELPFTIVAASEWKKSFEKASFTDIQSEEHPNFGVKGSVKKMIHDMGGYKKLMKMMGKFIKMGYKSKKIRKRYGLISKAKRNLLRNKATKEYIGYILCVGKK